MAWDYRQAATLGHDYGPGHLFPSHLLPSPARAPDWSATLDEVFCLGLPDPSGPTMDQVNWLIGRLLG